MEQSSTFSEGSVLSSLSEIFSKQLNYEMSRFDVLGLKCWKELDRESFLYSQLIAVIFGALKSRNLDKLLTFVPAIIEMSVSPSVVTCHVTEKAVKHVRFTDDVLKHECEFPDVSDKIPYEFSFIHHNEIVKEEKLIRCRKEAKRQEDLLIASMDPEDLIQVRRRSESDVSLDSLNGQLMFLKIDNESGPEDCQSNGTGKSVNQCRKGFNLYKMIFGKKMMAQ